MAPGDHPSTAGRLLRPAGSFLLWTLIFAAAYCQAPLYFSNQNQYFLHGLADAGLGFLNEDWLANTKDPSPLFSVLVAVTVRHLDPYLFYFYFALLQGAYLAGMVGLFSAVKIPLPKSPRLRKWGGSGLFSAIAGKDDRPLSRLAFLALVVLTHAAWVRLASVNLFGVDYPWYLQAGVAGQYLLGPILQPSAFGVLLLLSLFAFARGRPFLAVACSSLGALAHSTYLLPAALLTVSYMTVLYRERQPARALRVGALALGIVLPVVAYNLYTFWPSSPESLAEAQHILVHDRIPHHAIPWRWLDEIAMIQIAWVALGVLLALGTRLFPVLLITSAGSAALTLVQVATDSDALALLFPWRVSTVLVPASTAIILSRIVVACARRLPEPSTRARALGWGICGVVIVASAAAGIAIMHYRLGFHSNDSELPLLDFVKEHKSRGDVYAIPVKVPKSTTRGSRKSDFKPLTDVREGPQFISVDLQRFRLYSGAPLFVDFKSIPYGDEDVLEWRDRLAVNQRLYEAVADGRTDDVIGVMRRHGITHLVTTSDNDLNAPRPDVLEQVYSDRWYRVYRLIGQGEPGASAPGGRAG